MANWRRDVKVEACADAILAGARTADAYARHFEDELRGARFRCAVLRIVRWPVTLVRRTRKPARETPGRDRRRKRRM